MIVCNCNGLNEEKIDKAITSGACHWKEVYEFHGCSAQCGKCVGLVCSRLKSLLAGVGPETGAVTEPTIAYGAAD